MTTAIKANKRNHQDVEQPSGSRSLRSLKRVVISVAWQVGGGLVATTLWDVHPSHMAIWQWLVGWVVLCQCIERGATARI